MAGEKLKASMFAADRQCFTKNISRRTVLSSSLYIQTKLFEQSELSIVVLCLRALLERQMRSFAYSSPSRRGTGRRSAAQLTRKLDKFSLNHVTNVNLSSRARLKIPTVVQVNVRRALVKHT